MCLHLEVKLFHERQPVICIYLRNARLLSGYNAYEVPSYGPNIFFVLFFVLPPQGLGVIAQWSEGIGLLYGCSKFMNPFCLFQ